MMNKKYYLIIVAAIIVWYYSKKIQAANALLVRYNLPTNIRISNGAIMWNQPVVITNPTGTPINLQRYDIQIGVEGNVVGTAFGYIQTTISSASETTIFANVIVPLDALIGLIPALLHPGTSVDFLFQGNIFAELLAIPIKTNISVPIPKF